MQLSSFECFLNHILKLLIAMFFQHIHPAQRMRENDLIVAVQLVFRHCNSLNQTTELPRGFDLAGLQNEK